jgi:hypothetical protein
LLSALPFSIAKNKFLAAECDCPRLDAADWHDVESDWSDITFVRTTTNAVLGVPVSYAASRADLLKLADKLGAAVPEDAMLLMGSGRFRRPIMLEIEDAPPGGKGVYHPGGFIFSRLLEAPWGQMQRMVDEARDAATERFGRAPDDLWVWYLTCRICSKERNFETLVIAHFRESK